MDIISLRAVEVKSLIYRCEDQGINPPYVLDDVREVEGSDQSVRDKLATLGRMHSVLHELLYAPPQKR